MTESSSNGDYRRTQAKRRAESELKLLEAALRLIAAQGYMATTIAQVGVAAGYSRGLVTQHFGSKIGLAHALVDLIRKRFEEQIVPRMDTVADHYVLHAWIDRYIEALEADSAAYRALLALQAESITSLTELRADLADLTERTRVYLCRRLEAARARSELSDRVDLRALVTATLGMLRGTASQSLIDPDGVDVRATGEAAKAALSEVLFEKATSLDVV